MIRAYNCDYCGHTQDVWRQLSKNMPPCVPCEKECGGICYPDMGIQVPSVVYKGDGWTPATHQKNDDVILDMGGDDE